MGDGRPCVGGGPLDARDIGRLGEDIAERLLLESGMRILARNWRCRIGELDIVARDGDEVVFCEVKTRTGAAFGSPGEAVDSRKLRRLMRLAAAYLGSQIDSTPLRFDVVEVLVAPSGRSRARHIRSVHEPAD